MSEPSFLDIVKSVAASAFGVQSEKNRIKDFQQSSPMPYIIVGIAFVVIFVLALMLLVSLVIPG